MTIWRDMLTTIFRHEAVIVIITGDWKTGKTNVGLKIGEDLLKYNLASKMATNIEIEPKDKRITQINDMPSLREWHFDHPKNPKHKIYIFDEAGKLTPKRRAMSAINVEWIRHITELSKGRCKLIVITQSEDLSESIFTNTQFTKGFITTYKQGERKPTYSIAFKSELFPKKFQVERIYLRRFGKTKIEYSPYASAEFSIEGKTINERYDYKCCQIAKMYAIDNISSTNIANIEGFASRQSVMRFLKRHIRHTLKALTKEDFKEMYQEQEKKTSDRSENLEESQNLEKIEAVAG